LNVVCYGLRLNTLAMKQGIPQESREVFDMLAENGMLEASLPDHLKEMVGFRNIAVHDYRKLNLDIVRNVVENRLGNFREFTSDVLRRGV